MSENLIFIIDRSSSVQPYALAYLETIDSIVQAQKNTNPKTLLTCALFNESIHYVCVNVPLSNLNQLMNINDLKPCGMTAFYDNVSAIIRKLMGFFSLNRQKAPTVIILTDGDDTCSKIVSLKQTALQISMAKAKGWQFIYLGITENSVRIGRELGCNTCILYTCSENGFAKIPATVAKLLDKKQIPDTNIDISDLSDSLMEVKIN